MTKTEKYIHAIISFIAATGGEFRNPDGSVNDNFETLEMLFEEYHTEKNCEVWKDKEMSSDVP